MKKVKIYKPCVFMGVGAGVGQVVDLPAPLAQKLVNQGFAQYIVIEDVILKAEDKPKKRGRKPKNVEQ